LLFVLACDFNRLGEELHRAEDAGADWHHVDVMDGHLVPNLSIGLPVVESIKKEAGIPLDVHLMIEKPGDWAAKYADAGADILSFHYEAAADDFEVVLETFKDTGCTIGVAVNPPAGVEPLRPFLDRIDMVLVMSVHAGFGGQSFMPEVEVKVREFRAAIDAQIASGGRATKLMIDGGIKDHNAAQVAEWGIDIAVVGSGLINERASIASNKAAIDAALGN
jgi:ribulose-phosphate 3-epimerase